MPSNITPNLEPTRDLSKFRFWCQKVLPLVYDDAISYYEVLCKVVDYLNTVIDNVNTDADNVEELADDFLALQTYVNNFFADIDQLASYATRAETAANAASASAVTAATQAGNAASSAGSAATSASNSASSALTALGAETDAIAAKNAAESAATAAGTSETNAGNSATAAAGSATAAAGSASDAASSATAAAGSATSAAGYADSADHFKDGANAAALKAEGYAVGKQNGEAVPSDSPYYHDNAAYWADVANSVVQSADGTKAQAMIADAEASSTAAYVHEKGTTFRYDGDLYVALSDIAVGDTITPNTNCKVVTVSEYIDLVNPIYNSLPSDTASGAVASFDDGAENMPVEEMIIDIEPFQSGSGTPSPTNVRPISGWTETNVRRDSKNLLPDTFPSNKINATFGSDRKIVTATNARTFAIEIPKNTSFIYSCLTKNTLTLGLSNNLPAVNEYIDEYIGTITNYYTYDFTNTNYRYLIVAVESEATFNNLVTNKTMIEIGTSVTEYEPYNGKGYKIEFSNVAGTVYGGTLDVTNKKLIVDRGILDLGDLTWVKSTGITNGFVATDGMPDDFPVAPSASALPNWLCSQYIIRSNNGIEQAGVDYSIAWRVAGSTAKGVIVRDSTYASIYANFDADAIKEALTGIKLCYELDSPVEYTLTTPEIKTLLGENNIYNDCGNTNVKYKADTALYIDKKIEASTNVIELLLTALRNNEMKAPSAMSTNDIIIVSNKLYKATTSIASGATLTVGTNVAEITVGEVLTSLLNT